MQILLAAMLIDAFHATLEDRIEAFNGIGGDIAANVLVLRVIDGFVVPSVNLRDILIGVHLVSHQAGVLADVGADNRENVASAHAVNMEAAGGPATLRKGHNDVLMRPSGFAFRHALDATDKGFVHFDRAAARAHHGGERASNAHSFADAMGDKPSGFEGAAKGAMQLVARNALLAGRQEEDRL